MVRRVYGDVKTKIASFCGTSGMPVTDPRVLDALNEAIEELSNEGQWPGVVDRWHIVATDGHIVLPPNLDMLLEFTAGGVPQQIVSPWAEFVNYGPGPQEDLIGPNCRTWWRCGSANLYDRGESPTVTDIPVSDGTSSATIGPWVIRQYANPATGDEGIYSTIQGLDPDGLLVRSEVDGEWINGVRLEISSGSSYTETTQEFSSITAYTKPVTNGYVRITAWNGTDEIELSNYMPAETTPSYHRYYSPFLQWREGEACERRRVVLARCRRRYVPVREDTDVLIISNLAALKCMIQAQWKRDDASFDEYAALKITAVDLMKKEATVYRPKSRIPALTFQKGFGLGSDLPALR